MNYKKYTEIEQTTLETEKIYEVVSVQQKVRLTNEPQFTISSSGQAGEFGQKHIGSNAAESVLVVVLDSKNKVNAMNVVFTGTLSSSVAHPREIFQTAILHNAARIIVYHNHPSRDLEPSEADLMFTKRLVSAGELLGIEVLDHIIVSPDEYMSLAENGLI